MLNDLKFVAGAIAKKDFVPSLQYFRIDNNRIYAFNGTMAISTPTDLAVTCVPKAAQLIKAIEKLPDDKTVILNLTAANKLSIKSGKFRVYVECIDDDGSLPQVSPQGAMAPLPKGLVDVLEKLYPFVSVDASRPWSRGVLLRGQSAFATNNIVLIEHWLPLAFPSPINLPAEAVRELIRIGVDPTHIQVDEGAVTFHYASGAWLRTQLGSVEWPDLARVLDRPHDAQPVHPEFFDSVRRLSEFADKTNRLFLRGGTLATHADEGVGACVDLDDFGGVGCHYLKPMASLDGVAKSIDFGLYPGPCLFFGELLRGAIVGLRVNEPV